MSATPPQTSQPTVDSLVRANQRFYAVFEALDFPAMRDLWEQSDRVFCVHPGWPPLQGYRPVLESWQRIIANTTFISFHLAQVQAHVLGHVGVVTANESIASQAGSERYTSGTVATNLFAFDADAGLWKIFHHHASHTGLPAQLNEDVLN